MNKIRQSMILSIILALAALTPVAQAQQASPWGRSDDRQTGQLLARIEQRAARFQNSATQAVNQSPMANTQKEDRLTRLVADFQQGVAQLRDRYNRRQATDADVQMVLDRAIGIDRFMQRRQLGNTAENDWRMLRGDLDSLAGAYRIAWDWNRVDTRDEPVTAP